MPILFHLDKHKVLQAASKPRCFAKCSHLPLPTTMKTANSTVAFDLEKAMDNKEETKTDFVDDGYPDGGLRAWLVVVGVRTQLMLSKELTIA